MRILRYDVVVVGGGSAGIAAAVTAARAGARTLLLERYGLLGGMATTGMVGTICGLYRTGATSTPYATGAASAPSGTGVADTAPELLNEGLCGEIAERVASLPGSEPPLRRGRTVVLPYVPHELAALADDLTAAEPALDVRLHTYVTGVAVGGGAVEAVRLATWEGPDEVACGALVDASGDAIAALAAGAPTETADPSARQLCSLVFAWQGVAAETFRGGAGLALLRRIATAESAGDLPRGTSDLGWRPSNRPGETVVKLALGGLAVEGDWLTTAERAGRQRVRALTEYLRRTEPAFAGAFVSHVAPQVGVRETRRIVGRYRLTRDDVLAGRRFDDAIARAAWPIELWREGVAGAQYEYLPDGASYEIPLRCLLASGVERLLAAGRCISGTSDALGSARVIGTCLATGEAAGRAAARMAAP